MATAVVGGAFLSAALQVIFDRLASREFINFFRGQKHHQGLLKKLNLKLFALNKVLNDAEYRQISEQAVKRWLDELKDAVYHADDLLDEIATEALRRKAEAEYQSGPNQVPLYITGSVFASTSSFDAEIESKLVEMIEVLDGFTQQTFGLGLREVVEQTYYRSPTTSLVDESRVYGRENDKEEIMKLLLSNGERSSGIDVVPIVGMGGVGKTTLAQYVYSDSRVDNHFLMKSWVCVSDIFDVVKVTRTVVEAVTGRASDASDLNSLQVKLKESLSGKKFLVVLDDVWNENYDHVQVLMTPFRFGARGSKIIVTTRNESVASTLQTVPIHRLKELPEKDCWNLFSIHAFEEGDCNAHPNLKKIGEEIVRKCKGLPLAAKTLGGLLRSQRDVKDWNNILESAIWELSKEKSNILPALRLSYHYLPSHLKRCFAYCSIYIKSYEFDMKELVSNWIAEGFVVKPKNNSTVEEEGYNYFHELLSRSFFQRSNANNSFFVMHDLLHDLAQFVIGNFCYRLEDAKPHGASEKVRHFSYFRGRFDDIDKFKVIKDAKYLRTFLQIDRRMYGKQWLSKKVLDDILLGQTRLRLLSLPRYQIVELPHSIGNLLHLRFLDLSYTLINHLPKSVCTLYNLETLLLSNCHLLTTLPAEIVNLILLRHLDLSGTNLKEMPIHISRLKDLQQLNSFVVGKRTGINELGEFHCLRGTISISGLQNVTSGNNAMDAKMKEKKHLEKLALEWDSSTENSQHERDVLEKLEPNTNLKHLEIKNYGGTRFPNWLGDQSFCNMVSLRLDNCEFCLSLPPFGQMPSLKELTIARMLGITKVLPEFYGKIGSFNKPFESLETLRFEEMSELDEWCILDAGEFSRLKNLEVIKCPNLIRDLPMQLPSLVRLHIEKCPKLVALLPRTTTIRELLLEECQGVQLEWQGVSSVEKLEISSFVSLEGFQRDLVTLTNLKELKVKKCPRLLSFPEGMMCRNNLKELYVWECPELVLPLSSEMSHCYTSLERLDLYCCQSLRSLPLGLLPKLRSLQICKCINFEAILIPNGIELQSLPLLESLYIQFCNNMVSFPSGGLPAPKLSSLWLRDCEKLEALPEQMCTLLPSLQKFELSGCPEIVSFPEGGLPSKLDSLSIRKCKKLVGGRRVWGLQTLPSLTHFALSGEPEDVVESFPEEGLLPPTLKLLSIRNLLNLKSLNNRALQLLGSLKCVEIHNCPQLESLPEEGLPTSLFVLVISHCPLLKPRCRMEKGEDWHKFAHVPAINIDGEAFFNQVYHGPVDPIEFSKLHYF